MRDHLKKLNSKQRVIPENAKQATHIRELEQKVEELENSSAKMASLVLGSSAKSGDEEAKNRNTLMIDELEKTRKFLKTRGDPLSETCKMNFEKIKTDLAQHYKKKINNLRKHIVEQEEEMTMLNRRIEEITKYQDDIINDKVDAKVKERLVRLNMNETTVETHLTLNPEQIESENDPREVDSQMSNRTDLSISTTRETTTRQPLPNGQHIQILNIENHGTLQINNDGKNFSLQK